MFWSTKNASRKYDDQFDSLYYLDDQITEYNQIKKIFKENKINMVDEKKNPLNLMNAIFMQSGLDTMDPKRLKSMTTKAARYPQRQDGLMEDPFAYDAPKEKKKKKG